MQIALIGVCILQVCGGIKKHLEPASLSILLRSHWNYNFNDYPALING
jgi:hypothetical protein